MTADLMLRAAIQSSLGVLLVWAIIRLLPNLPPYVRAWMWRLAALKCLWSLLGTVAVPILPASPGLPIENGFDPLPNLALAKAASVPVAPPSAAPTATLDLFVCVWVVGTVIGLFHLLLGAHRSRRLRVGTSVDLPESGELAKHLGLRRVPKIVFREEGVSPMLVGLWRPVVVLPKTLPSAQLRMALAHELAHVVRADVAWSLLLQVVSRAFWFVPPVAWAAKAAREASEEACDVEALRVTGADPERYAQMLVDCARSRRAPALALGLSSARSLENRIKTMLKFPSARLQRAHLLALLPMVVALTPWTAAARSLDGNPSDAKPDALLRLEAYLLNLPSVKRGLRTTPDQEKRMHDVWLRELREIRELGNAIAKFDEEQASNRVRYEYDHPRRQDIFLRSQKETMAVLTEAQRQRLHQMALQYEGARAIGQPKVAAEMGLSSEKAARIAQVVDAHRKRVSAWQLEGVRPAFDLSKLTSAQRTRLAELRKELLDASGEERKKLMAEYWPLYRKTWAMPNFSSKEYQATKAKRERNRLLSLEDKARTNARILAMLSPGERQRWQELIGRKAYFDTLPYAWG